MSEKANNRPKWFRDRGYLHLTAKQNTTGKSGTKLFEKITTDVKFIEQYAFVPLIHTSIVERRFKRIDAEGKKRAHSFSVNGKMKKTAKSRPIHYASHMDALIFGYYAELLRAKYEAFLDHDCNAELANCVVGYRRIPIEGDSKPDGTPRHKGTAHFAAEAFQEVTKRSGENGCAVLKFDIEKFFSSMDHKMLMRAWAALLGNSKLPKDHYNVFKAATRMHYVLLDDLRAYQVSKGRKAGFDEKHLAEIRGQGVEAFYASVQDMRAAIRDGELKVYKAPFTKRGTDGKWEQMGIPQGLPISAILANIYLLEFDLAVIKELVHSRGCYYRRYSDDLIIICKPEEAAEVREFVTKTITESELIISKEKTEEFLFKQQPGKQGATRLTSIKRMSSKCPAIGHPFTFLGFEFYGYQTLIKSGNLAKFYRRMIYAVKRKSARALKIAEMSGQSPVLYHSQLRRLYMTKDLRKTELTRNWKRLKLDDFGVFRYEIEPEKKPLRSNYLAYARRADKILGAGGKLIKQLRKHRLVYDEAVERHFTKYKASRS